MEFTTEARITQIIEIEDKDTKQKKFLLEKDNEWITITQDEYQRLINGDDENGE